MEHQESRLSLIHLSYLQLQRVMLMTLKEVWYLRVPALTVGLSFFFFACIPQTLEVYRAFALNPRDHFRTIGLSFLLIFLLSISTWYSGHTLLNHRRQNEKQLQEQSLHQDGGPSSIANYEEDFLVNAQGNYSLGKLLAFTFKTFLLIIGVGSGLVILYIATSFAFHSELDAPEVRYALQQFTTNHRGLLRMLILSTGLFTFISWSCVCALTTVNVRESADIKAFLLELGKLTEAWLRMMLRVWLPDALGLVPLLSLCLGLSFAVWNPDIIDTSSISDPTLVAQFTTSNLENAASIRNLWISVHVSVILICFYWFLVSGEFWQRISGLLHRLLNRLWNWVLAPLWSQSFKPRFDKLWGKLFHSIYSTSFLHHWSEGVARLRDVSLYDPWIQEFVLWLSVIGVGLFTLPLISRVLVRGLVVYGFTTFLVIWYCTKPLQTNPWFQRNRLWIQVLLWFALGGILKMVVPGRVWTTTLDGVTTIATIAPSWLGPIGVVATFLIIFVLAMSNLFYWGHRFGIPVITILVILAIGFSGLDMNDNHRLRELSPQPSLGQTIAALKSPQLSVMPTDTPALDLERSFETWIEARKTDISAFQAMGSKPGEKNAAEEGDRPPLTRKYPIYIVSAQGGGIFAAYHAALTLSRLQDICPSFAQHVFAISGVSGGSLGATVFSSLVKTTADTEGELSHNPCFPAGEVNQKFGQASSFSGGNHTRPTRLENTAHQVFNQDLLSPLLSAGLFPDLIQRFLPFPVEPLDRARGLEYAFEQAWERTQQQENPLKTSYYQHWDATKKAPALILNTTVVETGERLVLSPFRLNLPELKDIRTAACDTNINFPLSTAAVLSARFTLVTPVAWFGRCETVDGTRMLRKSRLADGGYFENSGISTAYDIGSRLERYLQDSGSADQFKIVYLAITGQPPSELPSAGGLNEMMSPINALWNSSMSARGRSDVSQLEYALDGSREAQSQEMQNMEPQQSSDQRFAQKYTNHRFRQFYLYDQQLVDGELEPGQPSFRLPLGWYLSKYSQTFISNQVNFRDSINVNKSCPDDLEQATNNTCVFRTIVEELNMFP